MPNLMTEAYAGVARSPNGGGAKICTDRKKTCTISRLQAAISDLIKLQNPVKTWAFVADLFGLSERSAKYRLSNEASYSIEELQALFQGEDGLAYLEAMMADSAPRWWKALQKEIALCKARAHQESARQLVLSMEVDDLDIRDRRRLKRFSDADKRLNAEAAQAETAAGFMVANAGSSLHSAMASAKGQAVASRTSGGRR